ncbi:MAG: hypothetical protein NC212_08450 [Staphylococcus sp.]|nr:hypothetical protein [Staphylococcus sp.]
MKKYIAKTDLSVCVVLPNGVSRRVSFMPQTDGSSILYTDDADIQFGLEHHYKFNKMFRLDPLFKSKKPKKPKSLRAENRESVSHEFGNQRELTTDNSSADDLLEEPTDDSTEEVEETSGSPITISVSDPAMAKDYLAEKYGVVRTKIKTQEQLDAAAAAYGIVFKYS